MRLPGAPILYPPWLSRWGRTPFAFRSTILTIAATVGSEQAMIRTRFVSALLTALAIPTILAASENNAANSGPARPPAVQAGTPYYIDLRVARIGMMAITQCRVRQAERAGPAAEFPYTDLHPTVNVTRWRWFKWLPCGQYQNGIPKSSPCQSLRLSLQAHTSAIQKSSGRDSEIAGEQGSLLECGHQQLQSLCRRFASAVG